MYHLLETLLANITTLVMVIVLGFVLLTRWREKEVIRTDTVHLESTRTDTIPVRYVPSFSVALPFVFNRPSDRAMTKRRAREEKSPKSHKIFAQFKKKL